MGAVHGLHPTHRGVELLEERWTVSLCLGLLDAALVGPGVQDLPNPGAEGHSPRRRDRLPSGDKRRMDRDRVFQERRVGIRARAPDCRP
jgi:hypothetical protein